MDASLTDLRFDWRSSKSRSSAARRSKRSVCWFLNASNSSRLSFFRWKEVRERRKRKEKVVFALQGLPLMRAIVHGDYSMFLIVLINRRDYSKEYRSFRPIVAVDFDRTSRGWKEMCKGGGFAEGTLRLAD